MKIKDFTKLGKHLLPQLPGFVMEKKVIFRSPFEDVLYGVYFESSAEPDWFYISVFFLPLFIPNDSVHGTFARRIGRDSNWDTNNPSLLPDLNAAIQNEAIPFLDNVATLIGATTYIKERIENGRPRVNSHMLEALAYALIKNGDYSSALESLAELNSSRQPIAGFGPTFLMAVSELASRYLPALSYYREEFSLIIPNASTQGPPTSSAVQVNHEKPSLITNGFDQPS